MIYQANLTDVDDGDQPVSVELPTHIRFSYRRIRKLPMGDRWLKFEGLKHHLDRIAGGDPDVYEQLVREAAKEAGP
jgi:hypothetical protein